VDTSDREVNIKILLDAVVGTGDLTVKQRDELLESMTDEVAGLVLRDNYLQNVALNLALTQAPVLINVHEAYLEALEGAGLLDRAVEALPDGRAFRDRRASGEGLTAPELAVMLAYTKNRLAEVCTRSSLPDDPALGRMLLEYFPRPLADRFPERIARHPLRREIIASRVANRVVDAAGITFLHRLGLETAASSEQLARAHLIASEVYDAQATARRIDALDLQVAAAVQTAIRLDLRTVVERAARWFVLSRPASLDLAREIDLFAEPVRAVVAALPDLLVGRSREQAARRREDLAAAGVPDDLARYVAALPAAFAALPVADISHRRGTDLLDVAQVHLTAGEMLDLGRLQARVIALPRDDRWQTMARAALRDDLYAAHAAITESVVAMTDAGEPHKRVQEWVGQNPEMVARARRLLTDVLADEVGDLNRLSVGLRAVRTLLGERDAAAG
jgi:glutamate dehydrogenase